MHKMISLKPKGEAMKTRLSIFFALVMSILLFLPSGRTFAYSARVIDDAGLFSSEEIQALEKQAEEISEEYDTNVWVYTSTERGYSDNYAREMLETKGVEDYPAGYIAYGINMEDRSYWVDAYGDYERGIFSQSKTDSLAETARDYLVDGEYYRSAREVLDDIRIRFLVKTEPLGWLKKPFIYWKATLFALGGSLVIGLVASLIWTSMKAGHHKDKKLSLEAANYADGLQLTENRDQFVHMYETRVKIESDTSSSSSSVGGGGSAGHTGSGGHF